MTKLAKTTNGNSLLARDPFGVDRLFNSFFGYNDHWRPFREIERVFENSLVNSAGYPTTPRMVNGDDGTISLYVDVPGYDKEDLSISYNEDTGILSISSKVEEKEETTYEKRTFSYNYSLKGYDPESFEAICDKGILTIKAAPYPKKENVRTIEVK